jgi:hypothetical protein
MKVLSDEKLSEQAIKSRFKVCECGEVGDTLGKGAEKASSSEESSERNTKTIKQVEIRSIKYP